MNLDPALLITILLLLHVSSFLMGGALIFILVSFCELLLILYAQPYFFASSLSFFDIVCTPYRQIFGAIVSLIALSTGILALPSSKRLWVKGSAFFALLGIFEWSCLMAIFSDHALSFFSGWEIASWTSFLLIYTGFPGTPDRLSSEKSFSILILSSLADFCLLAGLILLANRVGTYSLSALTHTSVMTNEIIALMLIAAFIKSAQVPFQFWLPKAMVAPLPVSAYLHSASLIQLGAFLLLLFWPAGHSSLVWHIGITTVGLLTFSLCGVFSLFERNIKRALAYTTSSTLGLVFTLLGLTHERALAAAVLLIVAHALYKSFLFFCLGISNKSTDHKIARLVFYSTLLIVLISMSGLPFSLGALGKDLALQSLLGPFPTHAVQIFTWFCVSIGMVANIVFVCLFFFAFKRGQLHRVIEMRTLTSFLPVFSLLALLSMGLGLLPAWLFERIQAEIGNANSTGNSPGNSPEVHLWSLGIWFIGFALALFLFKRGWVSFLRKSERPLFEFSWLEKLHSKWIPSLCERLLGNTENIFWNYGLGIIFASLFFFVAISGFPLGLPLRLRFQNTYEEVLSLTIFLLGLGSWLLVFIRASLRQIFLLSALGLGVCLCFASAGAADLVLTQLLVEMISLVILIFSWMTLRPKERTHLRLGENLFFSVFAILIGLGIALQFFDLNLIPLVKLASLYFYEHASQSGGTNLVNLAVIEFRALDTLGEITVLALSFLAALALFERVSISSRHASQVFFSVSIWTKTISRILSILLCASALFFFARGHYSFGGGFVGGLLAGLALFLQQIVFRKTFQTPNLCITGICISYISAVTPILFGHRFFETSVFAIHGYTFSTSFFFDLGVFITVAGSGAGLLNLFTVLIPKRSEKMNG